jgi:formate dehydrogenase subunit beta
MKNTENKMREAVRKLFADKAVDLVIGYRKGSLPATARPFFVRSASDADLLVWDDHCNANLAAFLPALFARPVKLPPNYKPPKIGVTAKSCDARSISGLVKEHQVPREQIVIIGMPCAGMKERPGKNSDQSVVSRACLECAYPEVKNADIVIEGESRKPAKTDYSRVKKFEAMAPEERWKAFTAEISKCIRCNACREACPNCYCKVCFADQKKPLWVAPANALSETMTFHIGRMFHQAGRCVECDACVNACPMGIDLRLFTQKLAADGQALFGAVPGITDEPVPALNTFKQDDTECFITDPEGA